MKFTSPIVAQASGSVDGLTFSHNRNGRYIRHRTTPTNPRTGRQTTVRSNFSSISQAWRALTPAQRSAWASVAAQESRRDTIGASYNLTGLQLFASWNQTRITAGGVGYVTTPLTRDSAPVLTLGTILATGNATAGSRVLTVALSPLALGTSSVRIFATLPVSSGRNFFNLSEYKLIGSITGTLTNPVNILSMYQAALVALDGWTTGTKISLRIIPISPNGYAGSEVRGSVIVG